MNNENGGAGNFENSDSDNTGNDNDSDFGELVNGMRPEFKEAMDSYEMFFDEYCAFMEKYNSSTDPMSMLNDYMSFMSRYTETMTKLNNIREGEMNTAELLYYTEVMLRINQKLNEIS